MHNFRASGDVILAKAMTDVLGEDLPFFGLGKWDLLQWDWDSTTGNGMNQE